MPPGTSSVPQLKRRGLDRYFSLKSLSELPSSDEFLGSVDTDNQLNILSSETNNRLIEDNSPQQSAEGSTIEANIEPNNADEPEQLH